MAKSRREANKVKCRQEILKASRRLFREKGYEETMIDDVADKAEISKATLYNYFPNKESLLAGTMLDEIEAFKTYTAENMGDETDADIKIRKALKFLIWDSVPFIDVSRRILFLSAYSQSPLCGQIDEVVDGLKLMIEEGKKQDIYRSDIITDDIVNIIMGVYMNAQFQWSDIGNITEEECSSRIDRVLDLALAGCYKNQRR